MLILGFTSLNSFTYSKFDKMREDSTIVFSNKKHFQNVSNTKFIYV